MYSLVSSESSARIIGSRKKVSFESETKHDASAEALLTQGRRSRRRSNPLSSTSDDCDAKERSARSVQKRGEP